MNLPPEGPYMPGKEPRDDEVMPSDNNPSNIIDIRQRLQRRVIENTIDEIKQGVPRRNHPIGRRGRSTAKRTLKDLGIYRPSGDDPA